MNKITSSQPAILPLHYCRPGELAPSFEESIADLAPYHFMAEAGVRLFQVNATPMADIYTGMCAWKGPGHFDFTEQASGWERLFEADPNLKLCFRLFLGSPVWWDEANPEELQRGADGSCHFALAQCGRTTIPSVASEKWRSASRDALVQFLDWLKSSGWSERVWGFLICSGITYEWGLLGGELYPDTSKPMLLRFRSYLRETYRSEENLQNAWNDPNASFDLASVPSLTERMAGEGDLRHFPRDKPSYDFQRCLSIANAEWLIDSARAIRERGETHYQIGTFYGYTLTAREGKHENWSVRAGAGGLAGGHHALGQVLKAKVLDYIASPYAYANRDLGRGTLVPHFPWSSLRHHGVSVYLENDLWTFTNQRVGPKHLSVGETFNREDSIKHQRLAWCTSLCRAESFWWFDLTHSRQLGKDVSNYSDPGIQAELLEQFSLFERLCLQGGGSAAQIALIIDEAAKDALKLDSKLFLNEVYNSLASWAWCGAPFDVWLAEDATPETMSPYKLVYVFAPATTMELGIQLRSALDSDGRIVWLAPGTELNDFDRCKSVLRLPCAGKSEMDLSAIAKSAGVHLYGEAPLQVCAAENIVMIHSRAAGNYALDFPGEGIWFEFFSNRECGATFEFEKNDTRLFQRFAPPLQTA